MADFIICPTCGSRTEPYGEKQRKCPNCGNVYDNDNLEIDGLKTHLWHQLIDKNTNNAEYRLQVARAAELLLEKSAENVFGTFGYAFSQMLGGSDAKYKYFLDTAEYEYNDPTDKFTSCILPKIVENAEPRLTPEIEAHIKRIVENPYDRDKYLSDLKYTLAVKKRKQEAYIDRNRDVFICCADRDADKADVIYGILSQDAIEPWSVKRNVPENSSDRDARTELAIKHCSVFLFVSSVASVEWESERVLNEIRLAKKFKRPIVEYKTEKITLPDFYKDAMGTYDTVLSLDDVKRGRSDLFYEVRRLISDASEDPSKKTAAAAPQAVMPGNIDVQIIVSGSRLNSSDCLKLILRYISDGNFDAAKSLISQMSTSREPELTLVAKAVYYSWFCIATSAPAAEKQMAGRAANDAYKALVGSLNVMTDAEKNFYDELRDADCFGILTVAFYLMKDAGRSKFFLKKLNAEELYSSLVSQQLSVILIVAGQYNRLQEIIDNCSGVNYDVLLKKLLESKTVDVVKARIIRNMAESNACAFSEKTAFDLNEYIMKTNSLPVISSLLCLMSKKNLPIEFVGLCSLHGIVTMENFDYIMENVKGRTVSGIEIDSLIDFAINTGDAESIIKMLSLLRSSCGLEKLESRHLKRIAEVKVKSFDEAILLVKYMTEFHFNGADFNYLIEIYLNSRSVSSEQKLAVISVLDDYRKREDTIINLLAGSFNKYVLSNVDDGVLKCEIVAKLLDMSPSYEFIPEIVDNYVNLGLDPVAIKQKVIGVFALKNSSFMKSSAKKYLMMPAADISEGFIKVLKEYVMRNGEDSAELLAYYIQENVEDASGEISSILLKNIHSFSHEKTTSFLKKLQSADGYKNAGKMMAEIALKCDNQRKYAGEFSVGSIRAEYNLIQALLLLCPDEDVAYIASACRVLSDNKVKADEKVFCLNTGKKYKFADFLDVLGSEISSAKKEFCKTYLK